MGKNRNNRKANNLYDSSDDDSLSSTSTGMSELVLSHETEQVTSREDELEKYLDALYEKRGSTREKALSGLIDAFESRVLLGFIENKCVTLLHQFINSIKRGSAKEASLASRAIGLLAITVGCGSSAHEVMEESIPQLSQALKSGSDALKRSSVLDCLAIISFIGGNDVEETEKSMKIIWELIHPKSGSNVAVPKPTPSVLAAGVSAWTFLLTTIKEWRISSTNWHESVSFLSTLLDKDDRSVRNAAGEAIAIIFEVGRLDKYSKEANGCSDGSDLDSGKAHGVFASVEALKGKLLNQVRDLSMEAGGKGLTKKDLNTQRDLFQDILVFIENGEHPEVSVKIQSNCDMLTLTTWTSIVQLNFLKRFLGSGFLKHMQDNDMLHDVFDFTPKRKENLSVKEKRLFKSPNSASNKERTQYLNKRRTWAQDRNLGHFAEASEDF